MDYYWIASHRGVIMFLIYGCGAVTQYIYYRHLREGRFKQEDLGYFWRLWRQGNSAGKIMMYATFAAIVLAAILIVSMIKVSCR